MSEPKIAGRDLDRFLIDPNFTGAFVGGPPLMDARQAKRMIEHPEEVEREAIELLKEIWSEPESAEDSSAAP